MWVGHAALLLLLLACAGVSWRTSRRTLPSNPGWALFWASEPWLATAACGLVVGWGAASVYQVWASGFETHWGPIHLLALAHAERLLVQWASVPAALAVWCPLVLWPTALRLSPSGRAKLAAAVVCLWAGLAWAAWGASSFLTQLPQLMEPPYMPFDALEPWRTRLARGGLVLLGSLGAAGGLVGWALWNAPVRVVAGQRWVGSVAVALAAGAAAWVLAPLGSRLAAENAQPLDPRFNLTFCDACVHASGLDGRGPHDFEEAPWVDLGPTGFRIDGSPGKSLDDLYNILKSKRELWRQLSPERKFPGAVLLNVRDLPTEADLAATLRTVLRAGYFKAYLIYNEIQRQTRPILGTVFGKRNSALRLFLAEWRGDCPASTTRVLHVGAASERSPATWANELGVPGDGDNCVILPRWTCPAHLTGCRSAARSGLQVVREWSLGKRVEAVQLRRAHEEYQVAFVASENTIEVKLMNDPRDPWDGFQALEARTRRAGRRIVWAMNAGMYHPDKSPVGLLVSHDDERAPLNTRHGKGNFFLMPNGVFEITRFGIQVQQTKDWLSDLDGDPSEATQSGPMLVIEGELHPAFERDSESRLIRNGIGAGEGAVVMAISTTRVNFYEFATLMRDLGCSNALYLDGNVSSVFAPGLERRDPGLGLGPVLVVSEAAD